MFVIWCFALPYSWERWAVFKKSAANAWFHMNNSKDSTFLVPWQEKHQVGGKQAADVFGKTKRNWVENSGSKSILETQKGVKSRFIPLRYPWKNRNWNIFPCSKSTHEYNNLWLKEESGKSAQCCFIPGLTEVTPCPTLSTIPAASCPRIIGKGITSAPVTTWSSERQTPVATTWFTGKKNISAFNYVRSYAEVKWYSTFGEATCLSPKSNMHIINLQVKWI